jgi:ribulose kinase
MPPKKSLSTKKKSNGMPRKHISVGTMFASGGAKKNNTALENRVNKRNKVLRDILAPKAFELEEDEDEVYTRISLSDRT